VAVLLAAVPILSPFGGGGSSSNALLVLQILIVLGVLAAWRTGRGAEPLPPALWLALGFSGWCLLGTLRASYGFGSFTTTVEVLGTLGIFWAAWRAGAMPGARPVLGAAILGAASLQAGIAIADGFLHWGHRSAGTFVNSNHTAAFLNLGLGVAVAGILASRRLRWPGLAVAGLVLWAQLWPVASRGGLVALVTVLGAGLVVQARSRRQRWLAAAIAAALLVLAVLALSYRFSSTDDVYRYARLGIWRASLEPVGEHPVAGVGPGMFEHVAERYNFPRDEGPVRFTKRFHSTHSQYLEILVETGGVGLLLMLGLGAGLATRLRRAAGEVRWLRTGALLGLGTLIVHGAVETVLSAPAVALTAAALAGAALAEKAPTPRPGSRRTDPGLLWPALSLALGLFYLLILAPWLGDRHFARMNAAQDPAAFRGELAAALRHNPLQPYYYFRATQRLLAGLDRLDPASYSICYNYAAKAARLNPSDPWLHTYRARVSRRGAWEVFPDRAGAEEALRHYRRAVEEAPADPRHVLEMGGLLLVLGRGEEALAAADAALALEPHFLEAHRLRIASLEHLGREEAAAEARRERQASIRAIGDYRPRSDYEAAILAQRQEGNR
jgi:O-antigen ligase